MEGERREHTFLWFIEQYSYCSHQNGEVLISPAFTPDGLKDNSWNLMLHPRGIDANNESHVSLFLQRSPSDTGPESIMVNCELSFSFNTITVSHALDNVSFKKGRGHGFPRFLTLKDMFVRIREEDVLIVACRIWKGDRNTRKIAPICAMTRIGIESITFMHVIENFSSLQPYQRHTVKVPSNSGNECLALSSALYTGDGCIIVEITPTDNRHVLSEAKVSVLSYKHKMLCGQADIRFSATKQEIRFIQLSTHLHEIMDGRNNILLDGKLCLLCEVVLSTGLQFTRIEKSRPKIYGAAARLKGKVYKNAERSGHSSLSAAMTALYMNGSLTEVELRTSTGSFPAHKIVLCARSPVFQAMLTSDVLEQKTNIVRVDDLEDWVIQQFLLFLYTDAIENLDWEIAPRLYYAADKYQVDALKEACASYMIENLTPASAGELLLLADIHSDNALKALVEDFIQEYKQQVFASAGWERLTETHPLLVMKAIQLNYAKEICNK